MDSNCYDDQEFKFYITRLQRLEESLRDEPEEQKSEKRAQHAVKETEFLRLKRSKLGVDDFDPIKVIGRGAFGEVCILLKYIPHKADVPLIYLLIKHSHLGGSKYFSRCFYMIFALI